MSPGHVSSGDTALLKAVTPVVDAARPLFVVVVSPDGKTFAQRVQGPVVIGREATCELVLADPATSRRHARLVARGGSIEVTDLGSSNGTFVDGRPVARVIVQPGSVIRVGSFLMLVVHLEEIWRMPDLAGPLVGGAALAPVRRTLSLVAPTELPVMILGETGTGKEVVARLVHEASGRTGPFVAVNCASLPDQLVESELFGHVRGAFTGADRNRSGLLAQAHGGTLFLDELGELPPTAQAKLLRVLEDRMVRPVGAEKETRVDVRFVSATNVDLAGAIADGRFRADLFARLSGVEVRLPSLARRREDLPALMSFLLTRAGFSSLSITPDAMEALLLHSWPRNIRELDNLVRTLGVRGGTADLGDLPEYLQAPLRDARATDAVTASSEDTVQNATPVGRGTSPVRAFSRASSEGEEMRERVVGALQAHQGNVRRVASALGIGRGHLYRLLKRFDLEPGSFRPPGPNGAERPGELR
jgi:DNA-binding NtrC family response regulator